MMKFYVVIYLLVFCTIIAWSQSLPLVLKGIVADTKTQEPMPGVSVAVKGTSKGTLTDAFGKFEIEIADSTYTLVIKFLGYKTKEIKPPSGVEIIVALEEDTKEIEEVIITSVAIKREKKELGYAVQEVKSAEITESKETNLLNALNAKVAGVQINASSGSPGAAARIQLRGNASLNGNNATLIVVDGIPIDNTGGENTRTLESSNRGIDLNPDDIASVTILKGPAAAALYGVRAANGAILITTKSGAEGKTVINFTTGMGMHEVNKLPELQTRFAGGNNGIFIPFDNRQSSPAESRSWGPAYENLRYSGVPTRWDSRGDIIESTDPALGLVAPYHNLNRFFIKGFERNNYVSFSGGKDGSKFFLSMGNFKQNGVIPSQVFERTSVKLSGSNEVYKWLKLSASATYTYSDASRLRKGGNWSAPMVSLLRSPNDMDITNGTNDPAGTPSAYQFDDGTQRKNAVFDNPYFSVNNNISTERINRIIGFIQADIKILPWVNVVARAGIDSYGQSGNENYSKFSAENHREQSYKGSFYESQAYYKNINTDVYIDAQKKINKDFDFELRLGNNYVTNYSERLSLQSYDYQFRDFNDFISTDQKSFEPSWSDYRRAIFGFFADGKIGFREYLFLNLTGRYEWASTISQQYLPYFTPVANLSFVFTDAFGLDTSTTWFSFGKIRGSLASSANIPQPYQTNTYYDAVGGLPTGFAGQNLFISQSTSGNPNILAEQLVTYEFGTEMKYFKNRLGIDFTYYHTRNNNQVLSAQVPVSTGYTRALINDGYILSRGLEVTLYTTPVKQALKWDVQVNFTQMRSVVDGLTYNFQRVGGVAGFTQGFSGAANGYQYGMIFGASRFKRYGQDANDLTIRQDLPVVVDSLGRPTIEVPPTGQYYVIGNPYPDWFSGIRNTISYKSFTISMLWDIRQGAKMFNLTKLNMLAMGTHKDTETRNDATIFANSVNADGSPNTRPILFDRNYYTYMGGDFGNVPERGLEDASWTRLRELSLSYNFTERFLNKSYFQKLTLALSCRNLLLITPYTGVDPETNAAGNDPSFGRDAYNMPNTRSYHLTLNATF
ncbi:MAG: SusC/RagA family TonB-linked outer membrane protein [Cytophagales bacterium]|nr:SusC/RagA family TonB-linked outer membrane protein [Cytophagales bacterium]